MNIYDDIVLACRELLLTFPEAKNVADYANSRLSSNAQEKFSIGYFPDNDNISILSSMVGDEKLSEVGIIYDRIFQDGISTRKIRHATLEDHNFIIPYRDVYGDIIAIVGRTLLSDDARGNIGKYKNTSFHKGQHLFGLFEAKHSIIQNNQVIIVEGQFDCITAHDNGMNNVVALGSSNMTFEQFALLYRYTDNMVLLLDNDDAGKTGMERITRIFGKYCTIRSKKIPEAYKDLDQAIKEIGIEELKLNIK